MTPAIITVVTVLLLGSGLQQQVDCSKFYRDLVTTTNSLRERAHEGMNLDKLARPPGEGEDREGTPVVINMSFSLKGLLNVDEENGIMTVTGHMTLKWKDVNMENFNNLIVRLSPSFIWTPDIEVHNSDSSGLLHEKSPITVDVSGNALWNPQVTFNALCGKQSGSTMTCTFRFGSWTYSANDVDLKVPSQVDTSEFVTGRWAISSSSVRRTQKTYLCCPKPFVTVEYTFQFSKA